MTSNNSLESKVSPEFLKRIRKRHKSNQRFILVGKFAVSISILFLIFLLGSIFSNGYTAFWQHELKLELNIEEKIVDRSGKRDPRRIERANYSKIINKSLAELFPEVSSRNEKRMLYQLMSKAADDVIRDMVLNDNGVIGKKITLWLPVSSSFDMYMKGNIATDVSEVNRSMKDIEISWIDKLKEDGLVRSSFNKLFFVKGDSRNPETAGIWGSVVGSFFTILCCMILSFPVGVMTAIYLEEFAPKNKITDLIEVNLNNLAAVPSIVFGLLGLAIYIGILGMPRSASLVGGMTLALMVLPTIVITTRNAIKAVPKSIFEGALALGASKMQAIFHYTLPLAMPGIMTGTILSIARAIGETAPLLMIGMVAFVVDVPTGILSPATAMPVQIYLWSDSPEIGFVERTSAAIIILLMFLLLANALAVYLRKKFEIKW